MHSMDDNDICVCAIGVMLHHNYTPYLVSKHLEKIDGPSSTTEQHAHPEGGVQGSDYSQNRAQQPVALSTYSMMAGVCVSLECYHILPPPPIKFLNISSSFFLFPNDFNCSIVFFPLFVLFVLLSVSFSLVTVKKPDICPIRIYSRHYSCHFNRQGLGWCSMVLAQLQSSSTEY